MLQIEVGIIELDINDIENLSLMDDIMEFCI